MAAILNSGSICKKSLAHPHVAGNAMLKFQKDLTSSFCFLRPQKNVTPDDGQNPGATKISLPLRAGDKNVYFTILCPFFMSDGRNERVSLPHDGALQ